MFQFVVTLSSSPGSYSLSWFLVAVKVMWLELTVELMALTDSQGHEFPRSLSPSCREFIFTLWIFFRPTYQCPFLKSLLWMMNFLNELKRNTAAEKSVLATKNRFTEVREIIQDWHIGLCAPHMLSSLVLSMCVAFWALLFPPLTWALWCLQTGVGV